MKKWFYAVCLMGLTQMAVAQSQWLSPMTGSSSPNGAHVERTLNVKDPTITAKVFHEMPIDPPSLNPWFLRVAVVNEENNSWNVYDLGNVSDYKILPSAQHGYMKIALTKNDYHPQSGKIIAKKSTLFLNLTQANRSRGKIQIEEK